MPNLYLQLFVLRCGFFHGNTRDKLKPTCLRDMFLLVFFLWVFVAPRQKTTFGRPAPKAAPRENKQHEEAVPPQAPWNQHMQPTQEVIVFSVFVVFLFILFVF